VLQGARYREHTAKEMRVLLPQIVAILDYGSHLGLWQPSWIMAAILEFFTNSYHPILAVSFTAAPFNHCKRKISAKFKVPCTSSTLEWILGVRGLKIMTHVVQPAQPGVTLFSHSNKFNLIYTSVSTGVVTQCTNPTVKRCLFVQAKKCHIRAVFYSVKDKYNHLCIIHHMYKDIEKVHMYK